MSGNGHSNGNGNSESLIDTLTLRFDRATNKLHISGEVYSIDVALSMLAQATREYERQLRTQQAIQFQAELRQSAQDAAIAERMRKG